jgi:hypothetical protein
MVNRSCVIEIQNQTGNSQYFAAKDKDLSIPFASDLSIVFTCQFEVVEVRLSAAAVWLIYKPKNSEKAFTALNLEAAMSAGLCLGFNMGITTARGDAV